jgi:hypothetical protein
MYASENFKTKKALREAVESGREVRVFQPNNMFGTPTPTNGTVTLEGPWYPAAHTFYATATLTDGLITKVR